MTFGQVVNMSIMGSVLKLKILGFFIDTKIFSNLMRK